MVTTLRRRARQLPSTTEASWGLRFSLGGGPETPFVSESGLGSELGLGSGLNIGMVGRESDEMIYFLNAPLSVLPHFGGGSFGAYKEEILIF